MHNLRTDVDKGFATLGLHYMQKDRRASYLAPPIRGARVHQSGWRGSLECNDPQRGVVQRALCDYTLTPERSLPFDGVK